MLRNGWLFSCVGSRCPDFVGWFTWNYVNPLYRSSAKFLVVLPGGATPIDAFYGDFASKAKVPTTSSWRRTAVSPAAPSTSSSLSESPDDLADRITTVPSMTAMFDITVEGGDPGQTRIVTATVAHNLVALSQQMAAVDKGATELILVDKATEPKKVGSLKRSLGLSIGIGLVGRHHPDHRARPHSRIGSSRKGQIGRIAQTETRGS